MWLGWLLTPKKKLVIAIVNKSVRSQQRKEHASLSWILNHEKYTKTRKKRYSEGNDYFGFFPQEKGKYRIKGLERFSPFQIHKLSLDSDLAYYADTYGIHSADWYSKTPGKQSGMIYGGMSQQDIDFLGKMKQNHKLVISEFNILGPPTPPHIRNQFEKTFGVFSTGWTACFFSSLDTALNKELPNWLVNNYKIKHSGKWPFRQAGIAFAKDEEVVILEEGVTLKDAIPYLATNKYGRQSFQVPERLKYCTWFDVVAADRKINNILATFDVAFNAKGMEVLKKNNIPFSFPAVIMHKETDYEFYYFSGDFSYNSLQKTFSYFKGIQAFQSLRFKMDDPLYRNALFWDFYRPMLTNILDNYYKKLQRGK